MKISEIGEFALIERIKFKLPETPSSVVKGIGDDTAVFKAAEGKLQLMTTDMLVEGVHFSFDYATPWQIGAKALNINISDIVAMGGKPTHATVAVGLHPNADVEQIEGIYGGIGDMARKYGVSVVGGDTVSSPVTVINITLMGEAAEEDIIYRSGAKPGDIIFVTGPLGGSTAGLYHFKHPEILVLEDVERELTELHLLPRPRVLESKYLVETKAVSAMNDISDGLASELYEICEASGVGCIIYADKIPIHRSARTLAWSIGQNAMEWALYGGEDYQLVITVPQYKAVQVARQMKARNLPLVYIGEITEQDMYIIDNNGNKLPFAKGGYNHFTSPQK